ncbi:hypothetical protein VTK73DRAFT_2727 [Phialemonium thermophilum]|uniref:Zn(2)-C6 fungal-type domain-containing protein n=1 Tax=Phialemonium thermophilum TaxID=223376 RepID=A0ABR3X319_9PEZI
MPKPTAKRSACDECRAKRVRCLRAQDSMAACARCSYLGAPCVTSPGGYPGRPPKPRFVGGDGIRKTVRPSPADVSASSSLLSPSNSTVNGACRTSSTLRAVEHEQFHAAPLTPPPPPAVAGVPTPAGASSPSEAADRHGMDGAVAGADDLTGAQSAPALPQTPADLSTLSAHDLQPDLFWAALGGSDGNGSGFFDPALLYQSPPAMDGGGDVLALADQLGGGSSSSPTPSQLLQGLVVGGDSAAAAAAALDVHTDLLLGPWQGFLLPTDPPLLPQWLGAAHSLVGFRQEVDQRIATVDTYYADRARVLQRCRDDDVDQDVENPAALLLTCSRELVEIIQGLTPADRWHAQADDALSTEILLLALSSYLALMRLFDTLFHRIHQYLCHVPPDSYEALRVKAVLRVGGVSALQDMPLKAYAIGILDAIQCQVQTLERCMGIPSEYRISGGGGGDRDADGDATASCASPNSAAHPGLFSRADRAQLFWTVMAQEDIRSQRGYRSYAESIRASIKESMAFLDTR